MSRWESKKNRTCRFRFDLGIMFDQFNTNFSVSNGWHQFVVIFFFVLGVAIKELSSSKQSIKTKEDKRNQTNDSVIVTSTHHTTSNNSSYVTDLTEDQSAMLLYDNAIVSPRHVNTTTNYNSNSCAVTAAISSPKYDPVAKNMSGSNEFDQSERIYAEVTEDFLIPSTNSKANECYAANG